VVGVLGGAELGVGRRPVGIEGGERAVDDHQRNSAQRRRKIDQDFFADLVFGDFELAEAGAESVAGADDEIVLVAGFFGERALVEGNFQGGEARFDGLAQQIGIVELFVDFVAAIDEIEIHPSRATRCTGKFVTSHDVLEKIGRGLRAYFGDGVVMAAGAHDGRGVGGGEFGAGFQSFGDGFRAARVVVARVDAKLIDGGGGAKDSQRIEEFDVVAAFGEADGDGRAVDAGAANGDFFWGGHGVGGAVTKGGEACAWGWCMYFTKAPAKRPRER
jgi:hypothetical protein